MREQVSHLLVEAAQTRDIVRKRKLASRAFALAQQAEAAERRAVRQLQEAHRQ